MREELQRVRASVLTNCLVALLGSSCPLVTLLGAVYHCFPLMMAGVLGAAANVIFIIEGLADRPVEK
jgi:hypothetical protein